MLALTPIRQFAVSAFFALVLGLATPGRAQTYSIDWFTLAGGGGVSAGGAYSVSGTVGEPEAGSMSGGDFTVESGFWAVVAEVPPQLAITLDNGFLTVSWSLSATGFVLDHTPALQGPTITWTPVSPPYASNATHYFITLPAPSANAFFRLHKP